MKRFMTFVVVAAMLLGVSSVAYANLCAFDVVPAATLLFPFVQFDYNAPSSGDTTLFAITNVSSEAQVVHITLWTDYSVAILDFNVLLTGYDVHTFNIRDILELGQLPQTPDNTAAGDTPGSNGPVSEANDLVGWFSDQLDDPQSRSVLTCDEGNPGDYGPEPIDPIVRGLFKEWLQRSQTERRWYTDLCGTYPDPLNPPPGNSWNPGDPGFDPQAWGLDSAVEDTWWTLRDDSTPTWMYITADVATRCNLQFPFSPGYFATATGSDRLASDDNVIIGDMFYLNNTDNLSEAYQAVHLEADVDIDFVGTELVGSGVDEAITFYSRFTTADTSLPHGDNSLGADDHREPLPTAWAFRYMNDPANQAETYIRAFKTGTWDNDFNGNTLIEDLWIYESNQLVSDFVASNCLAYTYYAWDEEENVLTGGQTPFSRPDVGDIVANLLPLETQEVNVNNFALPGSYGWMLFVWPWSNIIQGGNPQVDVDYYQTWMGVRYKAFGNRSMGMTATVMGNYNCFSDQILPNLGIDYDYANTFGYTVSPNVP
jgi:hypothetical protein